MFLFVFLLSSKITRYAELGHSVPIPIHRLPARKPATNKYPFFLSSMPAESDTEKVKLQ